MSAHRALLPQFCQYCKRTNTDEYNSVLSDENNSNTDEYNSVLSVFAQYVLGAPYLHFCTSKASKLSTCYHQLWGRVRAQREKWHVLGALLSPNRPVLSVFALWYSSVFVLLY
jgi:hypothetical protein